MPDFVAGSILTVRVDGVDVTNGSWWHTMSPMITHCDVKLNDGTIISCKLDRTIIAVKTSKHDIKLVDGVYRDGVGDRVIDLRVTERR